MELSNQGTLNMSLNLDLNILKIINKPIFPLDYISVFFIYVVYSLLFFFIYYFYRKKKARKLFHIIISSFSGYLLILFLKYIINRPRPYTTFPGDVNPILFKSDPSFPSSHAFIAFLLLNFLPKEFPKWTKILIIFYIFLVPLLSLYIGVHYPSDVIVGAIIGSFYSKIVSEEFSYSFVNKIFKKRISK